MWGFQGYGYYKFMPLSTLSVFSLLEPIVQRDVYHLYIEHDFNWYKKHLFFKSTLQT